MVMADFWVAMVVVTTTAGLSFFFSSVAAVMATMDSLAAMVVDVAANLETEH